MGQIIGSAAKPKRCNLSKLSQLGTPAAGEYILVSSDNSMNAAGQGNFDCYIIGNNSTAATALEKHYLNESELIIIQTLINSLQGDVVTSDDFTYDGFIYKTTGNLTSHSTYKATDFIPVIPSVTYIAKFNATSNACCGFYGKNKAFTGEFIQNSGTSEIEITIPKGAYYIRMTSSLEAARMLKLKGYNFADIIANLSSKADIANTVTKTERDYNILNGLSPTQNVVLNADGTTTANVSFFTYEKVDTSEYVGKTLFPFNEVGSAQCFRNMVTFDASDNVVRAVSGTASMVSGGFSLQENEVKVSFCFRKDAAHPEPEHYISTVIGNPPYYEMDEVEVPFEYVTGAKMSEIENDAGYLNGDNAAGVTLHDYNILNGLTPSASTILNADGTTSAYAGFFTYERIDVSQYVGRKLYSYNNATANGFRNAVFYDANGDKLEAVSGNPSVAAGTTVPDGASTMSICYSTAVTEYWVALKAGNPTYKVLDDVKIPYGYLFDVPKMLRPKIYPLTKLPCISIQFDDMNYNGDAQVVELFKKYNAVCGFACIGNSTRMAADYAEDYLLWNKDGFDIINHSINGKVFNTTNYTYSTALAAIMEAKNNLEKRGYVVNGFVAPSSAMEESFKPILRLSQGFAFTTSTMSTTANGRNADRCDLHRYSMQTFTLAQIKSFIDDCITNDQIITLYGHTAGFGSTYNDLWDLDKVEAILEYIIEKRDAGLLYFGSTTDCVKYYFDV